MRRRLSRWGAAGLVVVLGSALVPAGPSQGDQGSRAQASTAGAPRDGRIVVADVDSGQLKTLNPDGSAVLPVSPPGKTAVQPAWGPGGSRIAFAGDNAGDFRIFVVRANGSGMAQLTSDRKGWTHWTPTYTPDASRVIFTRCRPDPPGGCALYSVGTHGRGLRALTAYGDHNDFYPDVSPNGRQIAFTRFDYRGVLCRIWVMRADGSHAHPITSARFEAGDPQWTRDGRHLLVTSAFSHVGENIYRIRADGSDVTKLTGARFPHNAELAAPSPSGSWIAFADDRAYPQVIGADVFVMRPNGRGQHGITAKGRLLDPDWGSAPLIKPGTAEPQYRTANPSATRRTTLPLWLPGTPQRHRDSALGWPGRGL